MANTHVKLQKSMKKMLISLNQVHLQLVGNPWIIRKFFSFSNFHLSSRPLWTASSLLPQSQSFYLGRIKRKERSSCIVCGHELHTRDFARFWAYPTVVPAEFFPHSLKGVGLSYNYQLTPRNTRHLGQERSQKNIRVGGVSFNFWRHL